eukprot:5758953-Karenia_brevis.AAC.1
MFKILFDIDFFEENQIPDRKETVEFSFYTKSDFSTFAETGSGASRICVWGMQNLGLGQAQAATSGPNMRLPNLPP